MLDAHHNCVSCHLVEVWAHPGQNTLSTLPHETPPCTIFFDSPPDLLKSLLRLHHGTLGAALGYGFRGVNLQRQCPQYMHRKNTCSEGRSFLFGLRVTPTTSYSQLDARLMANLPQKLLHFYVNGNPWRCSCHLMAALSKASRLSCKPNCRNLVRYQLDLDINFIVCLLEH